jgi:hypothetical protein
MVTWLNVIRLTLSAISIGISCASTEGALGLSIKGRIQYLADPDVPNKNAQRTSDFIRSFEWFSDQTGRFECRLTGESPQSESGMRFQLTCDGIDTFSVSDAPRYSVVKRGVLLPSAYAMIRRQRRPETDETLGSFLWLAFGSFSYFTSQTNGMAFPPKAGIESSPSQLARVELKADPNSASPQLIKYFARAMGPSNPPEWLLGTFSWLEPTNVANVSLPQRAVYEEFVPWRSKDQGPIIRAFIDVQSVEEMNKETAFRPVVGPGIAITDFRFRTLVPAVDTLSYFLKDNQWRDVNHPYLQQLYAESLRPPRTGVALPVKPLFWITTISFVAFLIKRQLPYKTSNKRT